jgi:hypothetical protein
MASNASIQWSKALTGKVADCDWEGKWQFSTVMADTRDSRSIPDLALAASCL